jgi:hypothetical protein
MKSFICAVTVNQYNCFTIYYFFINSCHVILYDTVWLLAVSSSTAVACPARFYTHGVKVDNLCFGIFFSFMNPFQYLVCQKIAVAPFSRAAVKNQNFIAHTSLHAMRNIDNW